MKKGWERKTLGEAFVTATGNTPPKNNTKFYGDFMPLVKPPELCDGQLDSAEDGLSKAGAEVARTLPPNSILVSCIGNLGKIALNVVPVAFNQQINAILPEVSKAVPEFMFYQVLSCGFKDQLEELASGTTVPIVNKSKFNSIHVVLPPLPDQHRIVSILDEAFAGLATTKATAKATAEKNLHNARALFESHLQSVFSQRGKGWVEKRLADVSDFKNGLNFTRQSNGQILRMVGVGDFQDHSVVPIETLQSVTIDGKLSDDYLIRRDDILTVRSNGSKDLVGRCMLVPDVDGMTSFSGFIIRIRFDTRAVNPRFLLHFMKSSATRDRLTRDGGGANISNINQAKLSELPVSLPSFSQQEEIANRLDALREETTRLAAIYQQKLAALEALKKSLLLQAFSGAL